MMHKKGLRHLITPKGFFIGVIVASIIAVYKYGIQLHKPRLPQLLQHVTRESEATAVSSTNNISAEFTKVNVNVNNRHSFVGLKINNELYVPFQFLKDYYEVHGEFLPAKTNTVEIEEEEADTENFVWSHTSKTDLDPLNLWQSKYTPHGMYLNFKESDVANRARVKCICGKYEVPITTQWDANGYYYPTQIAQYGLSHLSKHIGEKPPRTKEFKLDIQKGLTGRYSSALNIKELNIIKVKMMQQLTSFSVKVLASDQNKYVLHYATDNSLITRVGKSIIHGLGVELRKNQIVRNLAVDLVKGLSFRDGKRQGNTVNISIRKIFGIVVQNVQFVNGVEFTEVDHVPMYLAAADWFVDFQDGGGGWKTNVSRVVFKGMRREAGWYSSMGQGQALSLLSRVYKLTGKSKYLRTALKSTSVFNVPSNKEGVLALLFGKYPWYEEYPTTPPLFVLNGFIYSLFGLYDLLRVAPKTEGVEASRLFQQGLKSLETLLPLFDSGHGSFYDLRHITVPGHPPNRARWQYHRVHLEQLFAIVDISGSQIVNRTLSRWVQYASGVPAKHN